MKLADFERLKKFMAMTTSPNEHEAMGGLKAANMLLEREGLTWARVLDRSVKVIQEVEAAPESYSEPPHKRGTTGNDNKDIDDAIDVIERRTDLRGDFENLITDIIAQHRSGKRLSEKQKAVLMKASAR